MPEQHLPADHSVWRSDHRAPGGAEGIGSLQQGMLEQSNVSVVDEFVQMIVAQRGYESNSRVVKAADEMMQQINQISQ